MRILQVAYPFAPVTADPVGGAEQVLATLDRALVGAGHRSTVIACAGSRPAGRLVPVPAALGAIDDVARAPVHAAVRAAIARESDAHDLVHLHGIDFHDYLPPPGPPVLVTLHLPLAWYPPEALAPRRPATWLVPVSRSQAALAPPGAGLLAPLENGVDLGGYLPQRRRGFVLALGRLCPEKGHDVALDAARLARVPLLIAGGLFPYPEHERWYAHAIAPRLGQAARALGPVMGAAKRRLLAAAKCVLIPSRAPETSSLVAMEAAAAGTAVVASAVGALPEVVVEGETGFLVPPDDPAAMAAAIARVGAIDPQRCRREARARFDARRMVAGYFELYSALGAGARVASTAA